MKIQYGLNIPPKFKKIFNSLEIVLDNEGNMDSAPVDEEVLIIEVGY